LLFQPVLFFSENGKLLRNVNEKNAARNLPTPLNGQITPAKDSKPGYNNKKNLSGFPNWVNREQ